MAANIINNGTAQPHPNVQHNGNLVLPPARDPLPENPSSTGAQDLVLPPALHVPNPIVGHADYKALHTAMYSTLQVVQANIDGVDTGYVITNYLSMTPAQFTAWKQANPIVAAYQQNPMDLYKIF